MVAEVPTDAQLRSTARLRLAVIGVAILVNLRAAYAWAATPGFRPDVVYRGVAGICAVLLLDALLTATLLRRRRRGLGLVVAICLVLEALATIAWLALVGTAMSGVTTASLALITLYRFYYGYGAALVMTGASLVMHGGVSVLEGLGTLPPTPAYEVPTEATMHSLSFTSFIGTALFYLLTFAAANVFERRLRLNVAERRHAQQMVLKLAEGMRSGRLTGVPLAGRIELGDVLGRGGMGEIYRGRRDDGRSVAVKVLHPHLIEDAHALERFHREAEAVGRLAGQYVPEVLEVGEHEGNHFIVMELLAGEDLAHHLARQGRLPAGEVADLLDELARALDAVHDAGLVHRDIKPNNIYLVSPAAVGEGKPRVRLLDFGIAKLTDEASDLTQTYAVLGTPGFLAPEQARGATREIGPSTDVFALGAVAYRALTGRAAFSGGTLAAAIHAVLSEHPPAASLLVPGLSAQVDDVLALALAKDPARRYQRASELAADFRAALAGRLSESSLVRARQVGGPLLTPLEAAETLTSGT